MIRKLLKIIIGLFLLFAVFIGVTSINHPIILKWASGSARIIGKPITAKVYTNDQINLDIKVFRVIKYWNNEKANYYILYIPNANKSKLKIICLNPADNYAGIPVSTSIRNYDVLYDRLFQSEVGAKFIPFIEGIKGYDLNPTFTPHEIKITIPASANDLNIDSIRLVL